MSWNTWLGQNINGIVDHISQISPDIVGLQEIVEGYPSSQSPNTAYSICEQLTARGQNYYVIYFPAFESDRHPTRHKIGNAILSRYPIKKPKPHFLSDLEMYLHREATTPPRDAEPRIAIEAQIEVGSKTIRVINTHLGVSEEFKPTEYTDVQMERLMDLIGTGKNTVLMGDFNATPGSEYIARISRVLQNTDTEQLATWPVIFEGAKMHVERYGSHDRTPLLLTHRLDQIFIGGGVEVKGFTLGESKASDHKSLIAVLEI